MMGGAQLEGRKLRVLAVTNMYPTAATPVYGSLVAAQLTSIEETGASVMVEFIDGRRGPWRYALAIPRLRRFGRSGAFDVLHAHYGLAGSVAALQSLPLVVSFCGDDLLGTPNRFGRPILKSRIGILLSQLAARRADAIICKSDGLRARLWSPADRSRAHVIPNGVDTRRFSPGDRDRARAQLGLDMGERLVLFPTSPAERRKRVDLAEAAVAEVRSRGIPARLWVVYGVAPGEMPVQYRAADCLVLTSDWEGSPNCVKEALCCDLPVVSVDAGDVRRWLALAPGCALVERSPGALADGLEGVLRSSARVDGTKVRHALDHRRIAGQVIEVYEEAIRAHAGRRPRVGPGSRIRV